MCAVTVKKGGKPDKKLIIQELNVMSVDRGRKDIADFRTVHKAAEFIMNPSRVGLYDLYADILLDPFLSGIIGKRERSVRNKKLRYTYNGSKVDEMDARMKTKEFRNIRKAIFHLELWGLHGKEFLPGFDLAFKTIPIKHIKPHLKRITFDQRGDEGIDYEGLDNVWIMQTDEDVNNFGLLLKAIPWVLYKRHGVADLFEFIERYAQPARVAKYDAYDINTRKQLEEMLKKAGSSLSMMIPKQADFQFIDGKQSNSDGKLHQVGKDICDEQLSILMLGQTETTKSSQSSGYAQGKIHETQQLEITQDDMDRELEWLNDPKFIRILQSYGWPVKEGGEFEHVEEANYSSLEARLKIDEKIAEKVPIPDDHWYDTYKVPKPKPAEIAKKEKDAEIEEAEVVEDKVPPEDKNPPKGKKKRQGDDPKASDLSDNGDVFVAKLQAIALRYLTRLRGFFGQAPATGLLTTDLADYYQSRCPICGGAKMPALAGKGEDPFSRLIEGIAQELYDGKLQEGKIPDALYHKTADALMKGVFDGLGGTSFGFDDSRNELRAFLEHNIYAFSAAKSLTELKVFRDLLLDKGGRPRNTNEFRNACTDAGFTFNNNYLETERVTAISSTQVATIWQSFGEDQAIEISTAGDNKVRPNHAILDGFTERKSHPIWRRLCPPFDWFCRCTLVPGVLSNIKEVDRAQLVKDANVPKYFQRNPGIAKTVFNDDHPYYINSYGKEMQMSAEEVYGMHSVSHLYANNDFPVPVEFDSKDAANKWWIDKAGEKSGSFDSVDYSGLSIRFSNTFRKHVFEANQESRYLHVSNAEDIIKQPDEVWSIKEGDKLRRLYIKYYDDYPYVVRVDGANAYTMHNFEKDGNLNEQSLKRARRGVLLYRKN